MDWVEVQCQLVEAGLDPAPREGKVLLEAVGGDDTKLKALVARRIKGEPLAYVVGLQPFWAHDWQVGPGVLIPRPDSEILVREVLVRLPTTAPARVAEVGLGSGALLGSILHERPLAQGVGTELSPEALRYAQANFISLGLGARARLIETSVLEGVEGPFDIVLSNPPYIPPNEYESLENCVRDHEPELALVGEGEDGTGFYTLLLAQALPKLTHGGWLVVEIGHTQGPAVKAMFAAVGLREVDVIADLANRPRVVAGRKA